MSDASTSRYIDRVRRYELLDREAEHELAVKAQAGDRAAREALIRANLRFVVAIALKYRRYGIPIGDLIAEGNLGLSIAAEKFDPHRGTRFVAYAGYWVRALVLDLVVRSTTMVGAGSGPLRSKLYFRLRRERAKVGNLGLASDERIKELAEESDRRCPQLGLFHLAQIPLRVRWHRERTGEVAYEQRFFLDGEEPEARLRREATEQTA